MRFAGSVNFLLIGVATLGLALAGCASTAPIVPEPVEEAALPQVAAQYRTQVSHDRKTIVSDWRYWRSVNRVLREDLKDRTGDLWQRDGATLFHTLLFHEEKRGIEFEQVDLQMTGGMTPWSQQAQIVSAEVLQKLKVMKSGWRGEVPYRDYAGEIAGVHWRVRMRVDMALPLFVEQRTAHDRLRIELVEAYALSDAPWQPTSSEGYGLLDFADLGDHERDPFVLRVQGHLGSAHEHAH
jgi:hypothetical protein